MVTDTEQQAAAHERLSALMDGELGGDQVALACANWRAEPGSQSIWHDYHLIGDVLRSEDLACDPARDLAFLHAFRERLAGEPVVLAPQMLESAKVDDSPERVRASAGSRRRWSWMLPSVAAAGFVAVAGVMMLNGPSDGGAADASVAGVSPGGTPALVPVATASPEATPVEPQAIVAGGPLIRDARLDRYLDAHKQFSGSSALGVPSGFLRSATSASSDR